MKTVAMSRDFSYRARRHVFVQYLAGKTYPRVPEAHVRAILGGGAGQVVERPADSGKR